MPAKTAFVRSVRLVTSNLKPAGRQVFVVYGPLNRMITPKDLPREFRGMKRVSFGTCSDLAHPQNLDTLHDAIWAFKKGRIFEEKGRKKTNLVAVPWSQVVAQLAKAGNTNRAGFTFRLSDQGDGQETFLVTYLDVDNGKGSTLSWRLFLGNL
ncbi:MAG: hypothetical protein WC645_01090 [Candidatus Margulisiibacteriota bacterium]